METISFLQTGMASCSDKLSDTGLEATYALSDVPL